MTSRCEPFLGDRIKLRIRCRSYRVADWGWRGHTNSVGLSRENTVTELKIHQPTVIDRDV